MVALAELSLEQGYSNTTAAQVAARARLDDALFFAFFASTDDCLLAAYDAAFDQAMAAALEAFDAQPQPWAQAAHAALAAFLGFVAETPAFVHLCVVESHHCGGRAFAHRQRALGRFMGLLQPDAATIAGRPATPVTSELIAGGVFDVIHRHTFENRLPLLPEALPTVTVLTLAPFVGRTEALRVAGV